jgi:cytochrome c biogenesis protein CcmG/thiol:disulfide interchange protein DsbE
VLLLLTWATVTAGEGRSLVAKIAAGKRPDAPAFALGVIWRRDQTWPRGLRPARGDGEVTTDELRGRPVVFNFWASWCVPCRDEAPILGASAKRHRGRIAFVGIDVQDLRSDALTFLREFDVPYVSLRDRDNRTYEDYGLTGVPETYLLDSDGRIVEHVPGAVSRRTLEAGIRAVTSRRRAG